MSAKYDIDAIKNAAEFKSYSEFHVHLKPAVVLAMCADIRRYEKALRFYDDFACRGHLVAVKADGGKVAQAALAGDSDEPDAEGNA